MDRAATLPGLVSTPRKRVMVATDSSWSWSWSWSLWWSALWWSALWDEIVDDSPTGRNICIRITKEILACRWHHDSTIKVGISVMYKVNDLTPVHCSVWSDFRIWMIIKNCISLLYVKVNVVHMYLTCYRPSNGLVLRVSGSPPAEPVARGGF